NNTNVNGGITVHAGNRIPLVPRQTGKAFVSLQALSKLTINSDLVTASSAYARGNDNNAYQADGKYFQGPDVSPGYAVFNLGSHYDLTKRLQLAVEVDNLFNRRYYTAAQLAHTGLTPEGNFIARPYQANAAGDFPVQSVAFFAPGAPRRIWVSLV